MTLKVPHFGPHAGRLVQPDGTPVPERDTRGTPPPIVVPEIIGEKGGTDHRRGSVSLMQGQLVEAGWSHERAREIAVRAATRSDGVPVDYPTDAAMRRVEGDR